jgi:hypothetical protein
MSFYAHNHVPDQELQLYLDGELAEQRRLSLESHLAACEACSQRLGIWRDLFDQLERLPELPLERDLAELVQAKIQSPRSARVQWLIWLVQGAAIVLLLAFGSAWVRQGWRQISDQVPFWRITQWLEGALLSAMVLLQEAEGLLASIGPALVPSISDWAVFPSTEAWIWVLLIGGGLLGIIGNRVLLRGVRSGSAGR